MWNEVDVERIRLCAENKHEFEKVFPSFIVTLGDEIIKELKNDYPRATVWVGPYGREKTRDLHPDMQEPFYLDWVCFGFEGHPAENAHVGVLFDLNKWPITYNIGAHVLDHVWKSKGDLMSSERVKIDDSPYDYVFQAAFKEHQINDKSEVLDFSNLSSELEKIKKRVVVLYSSYNHIVQI